MEKQYKYDAFISYRHTEHDKSIASKLQKMLESYVPPKAAGEDFKKWRIFRDETELPTSSNLSGDIKDALENSRFLIVICSETTKESRWCMEEITYFKELHNGNNSKIITLVAAGEPSEVFPHELCNELIPVTDENGNVSYENRIIEPLAANVAAESTPKSLKKLKTEFLRVAAPLMGCAYDTLYNRNQRRRVRRLVTAGALIMAFLFAFGIYTAAMLLKINAQKMQLQEANKNLRVRNAEVLANQSQMYYDSGELDLAVESALESLEQGGDDAPSAAAEKVLTDATGVYTTDKKMLKRSVKLSAAVKFLDFTEDGTRLLVCDTKGTVYIIDYGKSKVIKTFSQIDTFGAAADGEQVSCCIEKDTGYILCGERVLAFDMNSGKTKWKYEFAEEFSISFGGRIVTNPKSDTILISYDDAYVLIDKNGKVVKPKTKLETFDYCEYSYIDANGNVYIIDVATAAMRIINEKNGIDTVYKLDCNEDGDILHMSENDRYVFLNYTMQDADSNTGMYKAKLVCLNKVDFSVTWETSYECSSLYSSCFNTIFELTHNYPDDAGVYASRNGIIVVCNRSIIAFDAQNGEKYFHKTFDSPDEILFCEPNEQLNIKIGFKDAFQLKSALVKGEKSGEENSIMSLGETLVIDEEMHYMTYADKYKFAMAKDGSSEVQLHHIVSRSNYDILSSMPEISSLAAITDNGNGILAAYDYKYDDDVRTDKMIIYDVNSDTLLGHKKIDIEAKSLVFAEDKLFAAGNEYAEVFDMKGNLLEKLNMTDIFNKKASEVPNKLSYISAYPIYVSAEGKIVYYCSSGGVLSVDLSGKKAKCTMKLLDESIEDVSISKGLIAYLGKKYNKKNDEFKFEIKYLSPGENEVSNVKSGGKNYSYTDDTVSCLITDPSGKQLAFINKEGFIGVYKCGEESLHKIKFSQGVMSPISIAFSPDSEYIAALCSNGDVIKFSTDTFKQTAKLSLDTQISSISVFEFVDADSLSINKKYLVDFNSMQLKAEIENYSYFMKEDRKIISSMYDESGEHKHIGYNYLDKEGLKKFGKDFLNNNK